MRAMTDATARRLLNLFFSACALFSVTSTGFLLHDCTEHSARVDAANVEYLARRARFSSAPLSKQQWAWVQKCTVGGEGVRAGSVDDCRIKAAQMEFPE